MEKDLMRNFSFSIYQRTRERYSEFKREKNLTHDQTLNLLIDKYEENEEVEENDQE